MQPSLAVGSVAAEGRGYFYGTARGNPSHAYLLPALDSVIRERRSAGRAVDVGCGNGFVTDHLRRKGFDVVGVDPSDAGIRIARSAHPQIPFHQGTAYDDLAGRLGAFDLVVSLEVVEHLYCPARLADTLWSLTRPGGTCVVSTPYHGYLKNLGLALLGRLPGHFDPLREGGHIKFFSAPQLRLLLEGAGFRVQAILRVGRIPPLANSMVAVAERPS